MFTYFRPLRRKLGMITLMLACVFAAGWVRSLSSIDSVFVTKIDSYFELLSINGVIRSAKATFRGSETQRGKFRDLPTGCFFGSDLQTTNIWRFTLDQEIEWRHHYWGDFDYSVGEDNSPENRTRVVAWMIPYWSIVMPLTLLSGHSLLRQPTQRKTSIEQPANA